MNQICVLLICLIFTFKIFSLERDSTEVKISPPKYFNSINLLSGGGNKNYHDDSFYSIALKYESKSEYINFTFEIENLINTEKGFASCVSGEKEHYNKTYNTTYLNFFFGIRYKYAGIELGFARANQTRGWCENILDFGFAFHGKLNLGLIDQFYLSIGNSDNFRVTLHYEIFEMGITYLFDHGLSNIRLESIISRGHWGIGLLIKKNIYGNFITIGELYSFDEIQITRSGRTSEVFNIRIGIGYLLSNM